MNTKLFRPDGPDLIPLILQAHAHLQADEATDFTVPGQLAGPTYLSLLLDQLKPMHFQLTGKQEAVCLLDMYRSIYPKGWRSVGSLVDVQRLGTVTEFVVGQRVAYDAEWQAVLEAHTPFDGTPYIHTFWFDIKMGRALGWVHDLMYDYDSRHEKLLVYLNMRGLQGF